MATKDAMRKIWKEIELGNEWIVDADLKDFFGSACHQKLLTLFSQRIADGRTLNLLESIMKAGCIAEGKKLATDHGVPQGGVFSPLASNVLLTPFDCEMRRKGYKLTRYADDWVVTCSTRAQAQAALEYATKILNKLGVVLNKEKTKIVNVRQGFEFLGYKIKRGSRPLRFPAHKIKSGTKHGALYAYPKQKSITHFRDQVRNHTQRKSPRSMQEIVEAINPIIRGWGNYYCKSHVRKLFAMLDRWIVRRLWSQRYKRWRNSGWKTLPTSKLRSEFKLVSLIHAMFDFFHSKERLLTKN